MKRQSADHKHGNLLFRAAASYFGIIFGAGFLLGMIRVPVLVPRIGERAAELSEMPLMFIAIFLAAGYIVRRYQASGSSNEWILVGALALALMVSAEILLAVILAGRGFADYIGSRDPVSGSVYVGMLLVFAAMPWLRWKQAQA